MNQQLKESLEEFDKKFVFAVKYKQDRANIVDFDYHKEEREKQTKTPILGDGLIFENKEEKVEEVNTYGGQAEINADDTPF